jgi:hypothetical protein
MNTTIETRAGAKPARTTAIWRWPLILAAVSALGLTCALVGDDWYDVLSWCLLALPIAVVGRALRGRA